MVRMEGIEPPRLSAPEPKSGVSTNFTTSAIERTERQKAQKSDLLTFKYQARLRRNHLFKTLAFKA